MPQRAKRFLAPALLAVGGLLVALGIAEALSRIVLHAAPTPPPRPRPPVSLPVFSTVFELAAPSVRGIHNGVLYRTNSAGFRGREYAEAKPPATYRIVIVGDSVTMGSGVVEEQTYPALLETWLNAAAKDRRYEVLNLGLGGLDLGHVVERLEGIGLRFAPDLIVYGFTVNDIEGPAYRRSRSPTAGVDHWLRLNRFNKSPSYLLRVLWPRFVSLRELVRGPGSYPYELDDNYFHNQQAWGDFLASLDRLAAIGAAHGVCVHLLVHTTLEYLNFLHPFGRIYDAVERAARARDLTVTQSFPTFRNRDERLLHVSSVDSHPNATGHELLARALLKGLRALPARSGLQAPGGTILPTCARGGISR